MQKRKRKNLKVEQWDLTVYYNMKKNTRNTKLKKPNIGGSPYKNKNVPKDVQSIRSEKYKGMIY